MINKTKIQLFAEISEHLIHDAEPSIYFNNISDDTLFMEYPYEMLSNMKKTEQSSKHHPEGSVWNHTMMVIDVAAQVKEKSNDAKVFMWAALLHDIGKPIATKNRNGKVTSYDHDKIGAQMTKKFLSEFIADNVFIEKTAALVRWHMQLLFVVNSMPFADIKNMKKQVDINEVALLGFCDRMGRLGADVKKEKEDINIFLQKCKRTISVLSRQ